MIWLEMRSKPHQRWWWWYLNGTDDGDDKWMAMMMMKMVVVVVAIQIRQYMYKAMAGGWVHFTQNEIASIASEQNISRGAIQFVDPKECLALFTLHFSLKTCEDFFDLGWFIAYPLRNWIFNPKWRKYDISVWWPLWFKTVKMWFWLSWSMRRLKGWMKSKQLSL